MRHRRLHEDNPSGPRLGWDQASRWDSRQDVVMVSPVVDPLAPQVDPGNDAFAPTTATELKSQLSVLIDEFDDDAPELYMKVGRYLKDLIEKERKKDMKQKNAVEEEIRRRVRKLVAEAGVYRDTGMSYSDPGIGTVRAPKGSVACDQCEGDGTDEDGNDCAACSGKGFVPSGKRVNMMVDDVGGEGLKDIAGELGFKNPNGALQFINATMERFKSHWELMQDPDEWAIVTLTALNDYINDLSEAGELDPEETEFLRNNPAHVMELETFRVYLKKVIQRITRKGQKLYDPIGKVEESILQRIKTRLKEASVLSSPSRSGRDLSPDASISAPLPPDSPATRPICPGCNKRMSRTDKIQHAAMGGRGWPTSCEDCSHKTTRTSESRRRKLTCLNVAPSPSRRCSTHPSWATSMRTFASPDR